MYTRLKKNQVDKLIQYKQEGASLSEISAKFHIAKSSASRYASKVKVLPAYVSLYNAKRGGSMLRKQRAEKEAFDKMRSIIQRLSLLYWAEGNKIDFCLTNTDPRLIRVYVGCLKDVFGLSQDPFRISVPL